MKEIPVPRADVIRRRDEQGLCLGCGNVRDDGEKKCSACRAKNREVCLAIYYRKKAQGVCVGCGGEALRGRPLCEECRLKRNEISAETSSRPKNMANGLCKCGEPRLPGLKNCAKCRKQNVEKQRKANSRNRAAGLCVCGGELEVGFKICPECRAKRRQRCATRKAAGQCVSCGRPARPGRVECDRCNKRRLKQAGVNYRALKAEVFAAYGNRCDCCGETTFEFLSIEHKHGGGSKHRREVGGGVGVYKWAKKNGYPKSLTLLCFNCNCSKGFYGECPHERQRREAANNRKGK
jgi:hypothetical protein